jgi:hypothetical protein
VGGVAREEGEEEEKEGAGDEGMSSARRQRRRSRRPRSRKNCYELGKAEEGAGGFDDGEGCEFIDPFMERISRHARGSSRVDNACAKEFAANARDCKLVLHRLEKLLSLNSSYMKVPGKFTDASQVFSPDGCRIFAKTFGNRTVSGIWGVVK